jgi:hypothetical protein
MEVEKAILQFLKDYRQNDLIVHTTEEVLAAAKQSRITKLLEPPKRMSDECSQWWGEISQGDLNWG